VTDASDEIRLFELASADGSPLPDFTPGAHIDVHLGPGLIRQYSLCNGPDALDRYLIAVKREPASRGGSQKMHDEVKVGDLLTVTGPRNHFPLAPDASGHLLLAGGIGVTPLLSMARHLKANGERFRLEYFTRSPAHTAFHAELSDPAWAGEVDFHYGIGPDRLVPYLRGILEQRPEGGHLYVCGPRPFMEMVEDIASHIYPPGSVHSEYFSADPMALAGPKESFRVRCARSQKEFEVPEADTIVNVLTRNGVHVEVMCEQGVCGTCLTGVLEGQPDHRDAYLTEEERQSNEKILVCCSRSLTPLLVLDL
jgi:vanillate O-demethylase ferredoxin subunit